MKYRYIASCVFTRDYPELSLRIQDYLKERFGMEIIRCCAEKYKVRQFEEVMAPSAFWNGDYPLLCREIQSAAV